MKTGGHDHQSLAMRDSRAIPYIRYRRNVPVVLPAGDEQSSPANSVGFGRPPFIQAIIDVGAVAVSVFIICATAASIPLAVFLLIFCKF